MIGAITGDIIGSYYEWKRTKRHDFELFTKDSTFTDDTVLTIAIADSILNNTDYATNIKNWANEYPDAGYGGRFRKWFRAKEMLAPYNSFGNGSAMRVSPIGFAFDTLDKVLFEAKKSAKATHNHPEGIKGAQAIAVSVFMGRTGKTKNEIREYISEKFKYNLNRTIDEIRPDYKFEVSCQKSVPEAIIAFLESENYEQAVRFAISLGGDSDTLACMAGAIAQAFYQEQPKDIFKKARTLLPQKIIDILDKFEEKYKFNNYK